MEHIKKIFSIFKNIFTTVMVLCLIITPFVIAIFIYDSMPDTVINLKCDTIPNIMVINTSQKTVDDNPWLFADPPVSNRYGKSDPFVINNNYVMFNKNDQVWLLNRINFELFLVNMKSSTKDDIFSLVGDCHVLKNNFKTS